MIRSLLTTLLFMTVPIVAISQVPIPPAHNGYSSGWGMNPTEWDSTSGSYYSGFAMYDPTGTGGSGWIVDWSSAPSSYGYVTYDPITMELWIEQYMIQTYEFTSYQWHRLGDAAETITFTINGTLRSNESQFVLMTAESGWDPQYLHFEGNIGVGDDNNVRTNIPITWRGRWGDGLVVGVDPQGPGPAYNDYWANIGWLCGALILDEIPACDHWFTFEGTFSLNYHEADGYYKVVFAGCPRPDL